MRTHTNDITGKEIKVGDTIQQTLIAGTPSFLIVFADNAIRKQPVPWDEIETREILGTTAEEAINGATITASYYPINSFQSVVEDLKSKALECSNVYSCLHDWAMIMNQGFQDYDVFLLTPPELVQTSPRDETYVSYAINSYIFARNTNDDGNYCTPAERDAIWSRLIDSARQFIQLINDEPETYAITNNLTITPNDSGIGNDAPIWVNIKFNLRVLMC